MLIELTGVEGDSLALLAELPGRAVGPCCAMALGAWCSGWPAASSDEVLRQVLAGDAVHVARVEQGPRR